MEPVWLREALFAGQTVNGYRTGTALSGGWFWMRPHGCTLLYRGDSREAVDFVNVLAAADVDDGEIGPTVFVRHEAGEVYFYVVRRANRCGRIEETLLAAVRVEIDDSGQLAAPRPNVIVGVWAEQVEGGKIRLVWLYCPVNQNALPAHLRVYWDGGTGQINYGQAAATIAYKGPRFYSFVTESLNGDRYRFAVRAEDANGTEGRSSAPTSIGMSRALPNGVEIVEAKSV